MRGQKLFIRPIEATDHDAIRTFLDAEGCPAEVPANGLVGKLVGNLVAVAAIAVTGDALRVEELVVAKELRRKRIGRFMLGEIAQLARKMDRARVVVERIGEAAEFLRRVGFREEDGRMVRWLG